MPEIIPFTFEFSVSGLTLEQCRKLELVFIQAVEEEGGQVGGGMVPEVEDEDAEL